MVRQRRTPGGARPDRRPGQPVRGAARTVRPVARDPGAVRGAGVRAAAVPRSTSRPAAARRVTGVGAVKRTSAPQPRRLTGRATVLFAVLIALALAYTYPVRVYLDQQSEIARMEAAQRAQRELIGELSREAERWQDDEYIKIQARERFYMVPPGVKPLVVLFDPSRATREADTAEAGPPPPDPWYDTLWSSVQAANEEPVS